MKVDSCAWKLSTGQKTWYQPESVVFHEIEMKLVTQSCFLTNLYNQLRLLVSCLIFFIERSSFKYDLFWYSIRYTESNNHINNNISKMSFIFICIMVLIVLKQLHIISMPLNKDIRSRHRKQNGTNSMHIYFITNFYAPFHLENALSNIEKSFCAFNLPTFTFIYENIELCRQKIF